MYSQSHILSGPFGNNAFSYDIRTNKTLFVPAIRDGDFSDVRVGSEVVFEDIDEKWILRSCAWLESFIRTTWQGIPAVVFDNHNHALYFWYEALARGVVSRGSTLVHIDEHSDLWENENELQVTSSKWQGRQKISRKQWMVPPWERGLGGLESDQIDLEKIFHFANYSCNVGNYIQPALREGIISEVLRIEWGGDIERYGSYAAKDNESLVLNLDLDFFAPELDYISFESKKTCILHFARQARLITIATSPFFIDQERAIEAMKKIFTA